MLAQNNEMAIDLVSFLPGANHHVIFTRWENALSETGVDFVCIPFNSFNNAYGYFLNKVNEYGLSVEWE